MPSTEARRAWALTARFSSFSARRSAAQGAPVAILCGLVLALASGLATKARAELPVSLSWQAPPGCPDRAWAEDRLRSRLGADAEANAQGGAVRVAIAREAERFRLRLETEVGGRRELSGPDCSALADAATLVIALSLAQRPPASEPEPPLAPPPKPRAEVPARTQLGMSLGAGLVLDLGWLDTPALGPELAGRYGRGPYGVELGFSWLTPRTVGGEDGRVRATLLTGRVAGCAAPFQHQRGLSLWVCLGVEGGRFRARGVEVPESLQTRGRWLAGLAGPRLVTHITPEASLSLQLLGLLGFAQPRFVVSERTSAAATTVHQPSRLSLRAALDAQWHF